MCQGVCFLCKHKFIIDNINQIMISKLLKLYFFENFQKNNQVYYVCEKCNISTCKLIKIYNFINTEQFSTHLNVFVSESNIYVSSENTRTILHNNIIKNKKLSRKCELLEKIKTLKLNYNKIICDPYIKFGKESLNDIIQKLTKMQNIKNDRLYNLLNELRNHNMEYNSKIPAFQKYINDGINIHETIKKAKLEKELIDNTNYLSLINDLDSDAAIEISINKLPESINNNNINQYIENRHTLIFS